MRIYLDNCCYNRPYDDQTQMTISLETQAKLYIQDCVRKGEFELVTSYILRYESSANPLKIENAAYEIMKTGIKFKDACHISSAIYAHCDYFISTDKRLLKYRTDEIRLVTPVQFVSETEEEVNG